MVRVSKTEERLVQAMVATSGLLHMLIPGVIVTLAGRILPVALGIKLESKGGYHLRIRLIGLVFLVVAAFLPWVFWLLDSNDVFDVIDKVSDPLQKPE
jgi:hypothetical protein